MTENSLVNNNDKHNNSDNSSNNDNNRNNEKPTSLLVSQQGEQPQIQSQQHRCEDEQSPRSILKVKIPKYPIAVDWDKSNYNNDEQIEVTDGANNKKRKHRDKSDLGDNFVAPDGGWGWLVAVASGINTFVASAILQQFGIIFRTHMADLGIKSSELTTIINTQFAISAITGLINGPMFRRFTFRQVAIFGSVLTFLGIFASAFATTFLMYVIAFSIIYGFGRGLTSSASSLAVITYFKEKRRTATSYSFGVAGIGPIICPYLATYALIYYGVEGTVLLFSALSLHGIACSLIYQPVLWHITKKQSDDPEANLNPDYLNTIEDEMVTMAEPDTPLVPRAADGWFGSRLSLNTPPEGIKRLGPWGSSYRESNDEMQELKWRNNTKDQMNKRPRTLLTSQSIMEEEDDEENNHREVLLHSMSMDEGRQNTKLEQFRIEEENVEAAHETANLKVKTKKEMHEEIKREEEERSKLPLWKKIAIFFDLDLLRDFGYMSLTIGCTLITFAEINFGILTPFILSDFGFNATQIATAMSLSGFCDLVLRFLVPPISARIKLSNKEFFMVGIIGMCFGRMLMAFTRNFYCMLAIFLWLGVNKAFRTIFWILILPDYVPLKRLPAASGLQLLISGIFSLACGPLLGLIRDQTSYGFMLHFLNLICMAAITMWVLEGWIRRRRTRTQNVES